MRSTDSKARSRTCARRAGAWSRPPTPTVARSRVSSTMASSSISSHSPSICDAWPGSSTPIRSPRSALLDEMTANVRTAHGRSHGVGGEDLSAAARSAWVRQRHQIGGRAPRGHRPGRRAGGCRLPARDHDCRLLVLRRDAVVRVTRVRGNGQRARHRWRAELRRRDRRTTSRRHGSPACAIASRRSMAASSVDDRTGGGSRVHGWIPWSR